MTTPQEQDKRKGPLTSAEEGQQAHTAIKDMERILLANPEFKNALGNAFFQGTEGNYDLGGAYNWIEFIKGDGLYSIKSEKEELEDNIESLEDQLDEKKKELLSVKEDLEKEKALSSTYLEQRNEYKEQADAYKKDVKTLCDLLATNSLSSGLCG